MEKGRLSHQFPAKQKPGQCPGFFRLSKNNKSYEIVTQADMRRRSSPDKLRDLLLALHSTSMRLPQQRQRGHDIRSRAERCPSKTIRRIVFDWKRGNRGKNTEQGFAAVIVFVPRERVEKIDALQKPGQCPGFSINIVFPNIPFSWQACRSRRKRHSDALPQTGYSGISPQYHP